MIDFGLRIWDWKKMNVEHPTSNIEVKTKQFFDR